MQEIYLIRHGQTDYNKNLIIQGSGINSDLNSTGLAQANAFYNHYQSIDFDIVITSKLNRSIQTVQPFIESGIGHHSTPHINEIGWGIHEGVQGDLSLRETYKWLVGQWSNGNLDARVDGGESAAELMMRCQHFIDYLLEVNHKKMLVCTHGRTLRCLMCLIKGQGMHMMEEYQHANTGLYKLHLKDLEFGVSAENDTTHLLNLK